MKFVFSVLIIGYMAVETSARPTQEPLTTGEAPDLALEIFQRARFALGWNNPSVAESILNKNNARVNEYAKRAQIGSPTHRAEERFVLARAKQDVSRVRAAGLASGTMEDGATGMIFAIPASRQRTEGQPTPIGDTPYELWYMSYDAVDGALNSSSATQASAKPEVDSHVYRTALGFIATQESSHDPVLIQQINLHALDEANLMKIARFMKSHDRHGKIPSRVDEINQRILYTGQLNPTENVTNLTTQVQFNEAQETRTA